MAVSWVRGGEIDPRAVDQVSGATWVAGLMSLMLILGTSAASVAEERELGTLEWQLTQPVPIRRQWWAKVMVTTLFTFAMGLGLPYLLLRLWFGPSTLMEGWNHPGPRDLLIVLACAGTLQALGMYASSLSRNTMKASALTVGLAAGLVLLVALCGWTLERHMEPTLGGFQEGSWYHATIQAPAWAPTTTELTQYLQLAVGGAVLLLVTTLLGLASGHFRQSRLAARRLTLEWAGLSVGLMAVLLIGGGVFIRLVLLNHQARMAEFQAERRAALVKELARSGPATTLTQALREKFGVSPGASNEELCQAIVEQAGLNGVEEISGLLAHLRATGVKNTEYLNRITARYGLPLVPPSTNPPATRPLRPPRQDR
jgi:ABC-type transport system involved in multi-copper enzyme maturation permease subunit